MSIASAALRVSFIVLSFLVWLFRFLPDSTTRGANEGDADLRLGRGCAPPMLDSGTATRRAELRIPKLNHDADNLSKPTCHASWHPRKFFEKRCSTSRKKSFAAPEKRRINGQFAA